MLPCVIIDYYLTLYSDAQNMRKNIREAMLDVIHKYNSYKGELKCCKIWPCLSFKTGLTSQASSMEILKSLQEDLRYIVDLWS